MSGRQWRDRFETFEFVKKRLKVKFSGSEENMSEKEVLGHIFLIFLF